MHDNAYDVACKFCGDLHTLNGWPNRKNKNKTKNTPHRYDCNLTVDQICIQCRVFRRKPFAGKFCSYACIQRRKAVRFDALKLILLFFFLIFSVYETYILFKFLKGLHHEDRCGHSEVTLDIRSVRANLRSN